MTIWQELLFLGGHLGVADVQAFAAEEAALEQARQDADRVRAQLSAQRSDAQARRAAANDALLRCA